MQSVIADALEAFGQDMPDHASDEDQDRYGFMLDGGIRPAEYMGVGSSMSWFSF